MGSDDLQGLVSVDFHQGSLRIRGVSESFVAKTLSELPLVLDARDDCFRCDAVYAADLHQVLQSQLAGRLDWKLARQKRDQLTIRRQSSIKLRQDQAEACDRFDVGGRRGLIVMPTGTGKTVVALELVHRYSTSTLIVVPVRDLMYQWHARILDAFGIDAGLIGDGVHRVEPVCVTTYDSAAIHMPRIGDRFEMIVFDEVHHLAGRWRSDAARMSAAKVRLGLTATPPSAPDRVAIIRALVGQTLYEQSITGATGKTLANYKVQRIAVKMNRDEDESYRRYGKLIQEFVAQQRDKDSRFRWEDTYKLAADGGTDPKQSSAAMHALRAARAKRKIEEQTHAKMRVLEDLFRLHIDEPVIVFTGSNVMARKISQRFMVPCLLSHCAKKERQDLLAGFAEGRYPVLVANRVLDEGVDLPEVKTAIVLGGLASQRQAIQRLGRVLRKGSGERDAKLYEVVTDDTNEVQRSRNRRRNQAYKKSKRPSDNEKNTVAKPAFLFDDQ